MKLVAANAVTLCLLALGTAHAQVPTAADSGGAPIPLPETPQAIQIARSGAQQASIDQRNISQVPCASSRFSVSTTSHARSVQTLPSNLAPARCGIRIHSGRHSS